MLCSPFVLGYQGRGGRGGSRGMGRGRGRGGMGDIFRSRKQNTSRPPSMHVDDFMAMEHNMQSGNKGQENMQNRRGGMKVKGLLLLSYYMLIVAR